MARRREPEQATRSVVTHPGPLTVSDEARLRELLDGPMSNEDYAEVAGIAGGRVLMLSCDWTAPVFLEMQRRSHALRPDLHDDPDFDHRRQVAAVLTEIREMKR